MKDVSRNRPQPENWEPNKKGKKAKFDKYLSIILFMQVAENKNRARFDRRRPAAHQLQVMMSITRSPGLEGPQTSIFIIFPPILPIFVQFFLILLTVNNCDHFQVCDGIVRSKLPLFDQALIFIILITIHHYSFSLIISLCIIMHWYAL